MQNLHTHTLLPPLKKKNGGDYKRERRKKGEARRMIEYMCRESRK